MPRRLTPSRIPTGPTRAGRNAVSASARPESAERPCPRRATPSDCDAFRRESGLARASAREPSGARHPPSTNAPSTASTSGSMSVNWKPTRYCDAAMRRANTAALRVVTTFARQVQFGVDLDALARVGRGGDGEQQADGLRVGGDLESGAREVSGGRVDHRTIAELDAHQQLCGGARVVALVVAHMAGTMRTGLMIVIQLSDLQQDPALTAGRGLRLAVATAFRGALARCSLERERGRGVAPSAPFRGLRQAGAPGRFAPPRRPCCASATCWRPCAPAPP